MDVLIRSRGVDTVLVGAAFLILSARHLGVRLGPLPSPAGSVLVLLAIAVMAAAAVKYWPTVTLRRARAEERPGGQDVLGGR